METNEVTARKDELCGCTNLNELNLGFVLVHKEK